MFQEGPRLAFISAIFSLMVSYSQVALINALLFAGSIAGFFYILIFNAQRRQAVIADAIHLPLPGCPSIHSGIEWVQWVPGWCVL